MNLSSIDTNSLIVTLAPIVAGLVAWIYQVVAQRMPAQQRLTLEQFARIAANKIEQVYPSAGSANKKQLATELVIDLFKSFHLPTPDTRAVDAAIESAVLAINQVANQTEASSGFLSPKLDPNPLHSVEITPAEIQTVENAVGSS